MESRGARAKTASTGTKFSATADFLIVNWTSWLPQTMLILGAGWWIYSPAFNGDWLWDDERYISQNGLIQDPLGFWKVWFHTDGQGDYYPLTSFVEWCLWRLWGNAMPGYHLTSLGLHLVSAFLLWRLFARIGLRLAWIGALFFTVHPIMVESVAWITELKTTLSLPPLLLAMLAWLDWKETGNRRSYYLSMGCFIVSMLAKTSGMMLPIVFLGYLWWRGENIQRKDLRLLAPFFVVTLLSALVTVTPYRQAVDAIAMQSGWNIGAGLVSVGWSAIFLLGKSIFPVGLLPVYPELVPIVPRASDLIPWLALAGVFWLAWLRRDGFGRHILFGFGFFMVNLVPVFGYILWKYPIMVWSMDHLVYLPVIGLIALGVAALSLIENTLSIVPRYIGHALVAFIALWMAWAAHGYAGWFVNNQTLWTFTLKNAPDSWLAHQNLGVDLLARHSPQAAFDQFTEVQKLHPGTSDGAYNLAVAMEQLGQVKRAEDQYRIALRQFPDEPKGYLYLGELMNKNGNTAEAEDLFRRGLKIAPDDASLNIDLAGLLLQAGRLPDAIDLYEHTLEADPNLPQLQYNLGVAQLRAGNLLAAEEHLEKAVALDPSLTAAHDNLGVVLARTGRFPEAIDQFEIVLQASPNSGQTLDNLALALAQTGQISDAIAKFEKALELNPQDARAQDSLSKLRNFEQQQGKN
jgi:protein O-mannosyl-transferase